jgi:hypothetical protein
MILSLLLALLDHIFADLYRDVAAQAVMVKAVQKSCSIWLVIHAPLFLVLSSSLRLKGLESG